MALYQSMKPMIFQLKNNINICKIVHKHYNTKCMRARQHGTKKVIKRNLYIKQLLFGLCKMLWNSISKVVQVTQCWSWNLIYRQRIFRIRNENTQERDVEWAKNFKSCMEYPRALERYVLQFRTKSSRNFAKTIGFINSVKSILIWYFAESHTVQFEVHVRCTSPTNLPLY